MIRGYGSERIVDIDGYILDPGPSLEVCNHSPDGFEWAYNGSGPAQLALALLMWCFPTWVAEKYHQKFKEDVISRLDRNWEMEVDDIISWVLNNTTPEEDEAIKKWELDE